MAKKYRILARNKYCVLLEDLDRIGRYKVRDIENEDIYIGNNYENARRIFDEYDLEVVRRMKERLFEDWLKEFA